MTEIDNPLSSADTRELTRRALARTLSGPLSADARVKKNKRAEHRRAERALWRSPHNARPANVVRAACGARTANGGWGELSPWRWSDIAG